MHDVRMMIYFRLVVAASALSSCQPTPRARVEVVRLSSPHAAMVGFHMHSHFDTMRGIERLLVRGKLDQARYFARSLAIVPDPPGLKAWTTQIALVRERAAAVTTATGVDDACRHEARLAEACASCHADTGARILFQEPPPLLADQPDVASRMLRHQWAADRIWEGVVGDAGDSWHRGLDVLAAAPLAWPTIGSDQAGLAKHLQELAEQARHANPDDRAERSRLYGEILVTCAACHSSSP